MILGKIQSGHSDLILRGNLRNSCICYVKTCIHKKRDMNLFFKDKKMLYLKLLGSLRIYLIGIFLIYYKDIQLLLPYYLDQEVSLYT